MKINEAINWVNNELLITDDIEMQKDLDSIYDMLLELQWYREQDLVKREDVKKVFSDYLKGHECLDDDWADFVAEKKCEQIPKAEPPKDNEVVMKPIDGDCETCKKFQTEDCELHLSTMYEWCGNYEPYIPKENE